MAHALALTGMRELLGEGTYFGAGTAVLVVIGELVASVLDAWLLYTAVEQAQARPPPRSSLHYGQRRGTGPQDDAGADPAPRAETSALMLETPGVISEHRMAGWSTTTRRPGICNPQQHAHIRVR